MNSREIARAAGRIAQREARKTRATWRGVVQSVNGDGSAVVRLPNGQDITVYPSNLFKFNPTESVTLLRSGNRFQVLGPSAYGGGNGSSFATP